MEMNPEEFSVSEKNCKIKAVFRVVFFRDDMVLRLTEGDAGSTYLHIRSASRVGFSDLGVNRRRVKTFFSKLQKRL